MKDDLRFLRLWDVYSPLLTATQKEITDLYFNYDLSLGEIAEQKGVSRQSISDCLQKSRKQLETYDEKLGFVKTLDDTSREYSAYMTAVTRWLNTQKEEKGVSMSALNALETALKKVHEQFSVEEINLGDGNSIIGKSFHSEE